MYTTDIIENCSGGNTLSPPLHVGVLPLEEFFLSSFVSSSLIFCIGWIVGFGYLIDLHNCVESRVCIWWFIHNVNDIFYQLKKKKNESPTKWLIIIVLIGDIM